MIKNHETVRAFQSSVANHRREIAECFPKLDEAIRARIEQFPEDNHSNFCRKSFQEGAGYAMEQPEDVRTAGAFTSSDPQEAELRDDIVEAFFGLRAAGLYTDREGKPLDRLRYRQQRYLARSTRRVFVTEPLELLPYSINEYDFEAIVAFVEGYQLVVAHFEGDATFATPHYHPDLV